MANGNKSDTFGIETKTGRNGKRYIFIKTGGGSVQSFVETDPGAAYLICSRPVSKAGKLKRVKMTGAKAGDEAAAEKGSIRTFKSIALKDGKKYGGTFKAADRSLAEKKLTAQGYKIISIEEVAGAAPEVKAADRAKTAGSAKGGKKKETPPGNFEEEAWARSMNRCECRSSKHHHIGRCPELLSKENRGKFEAPNSWELFKLKDAVGEALADYEVCCKACYEKKDDS